MHVIYTLLLLTVVLTAPGCREKPPEPSPSQEASVESNAQETPAQFRSPEELAQTFMDAVFKDPKSAYLLCEATYRNSASEEQFRSIVRMILPPPDSITSVKVISFEDEFQESDGKSSCSCSYEVMSSDKFQAKSKVEVDMVKADGTYWVRRFSVSAIPL